MREISSNNGQDEGEYANLIRYISTYRDRRFSKAPSQVSADDVQDASMRRSNLSLKDSSEAAEDLQNFTRFQKNGSIPTSNKVSPPPRSRADGKRLASTS
jgi:hypothetical protein